MRTNVANKNTRKTHEGASAYPINAYQELRRTVCACLLWEDQFYESGVSIAERIKNLVPLVGLEKSAEIAIEAREKMNLRHVPLWLARWCAKFFNGRAVGDLIARVIQRPDELAEFLSLYWQDGKQPLSNQVKVGLARAFGKFNEYQLAKYNRDGKVKLRDVLFLSHAKPKDQEQADLWKRLVDGKLETPDTWEVALSGGADKKETFERLMAEKKLGGLAFLRNLRNMQQSGVNEELVRGYLAEANFDRVLPFRFITAANYAPRIEDALESAMLRSLVEMPKLKGKTAIVVDNSGSMTMAKVSAKSEMDRSDAACAMAILARELCERCVVIGFGSEAAIMPNRRGFALREAIKRGPGGGTYTQKALSLAAKEGYDRLILITDEQSHEAVSQPNSRGYCINVGSYQNGIAYHGKWVNLTGWSEAILDYIREYESIESQN